jgi:signal transduction histidine kinase
VPAGCNPYRRLPTETELAVFRIGQAALHNVERHATAATVDVELTFGHGWVCLTVSDDGCGFQPPQHLDELPETGKLGLIGIRERAQLVGERCRTKSTPRRYAHRP